MFFSNVSKALLFTIIVGAHNFFGQPRILPRSSDIHSKPADDKEAMTNFITKWAKSIWEDPELGDYESSDAPYDIYYML